ncbi:CMRF35-like molecule 7 [Engystomops pustulosus]|uniref:CMRF35-like molecule 7 n=1 Tax=Engystomops pustulosus TaxID=76066 RepID=UPI003AFA5F7D
MKRLVLLLGSLLILGVWSLSGPGDISVHHGETLVVTCSYNSNFDNYKKYWCRGDGRSSCHIIVQSQDCGTEGCRASMVDDPRSHRFNVTMVKMRPEDSDTYQCGIERHGLDLMTPMKVSVLPGICRKSSLWEPLVVFPVDFDHIREKEEVEVYCQEKFERRRFLLKCKHVNHTFELQTKDLTPCKSEKRTYTWQDLQPLI